MRGLWIGSEVFNLNRCLETEHREAVEGLGPKQKNRPSRGGRLTTTRGGLQPVGRVPLEGEAPRKKETTN